ncbi:hypothetical protein Tco_0233072 [Tanacetum coccineum]
MTRSTVKKLIEPLKEPEREFRRRRKVAYRQEQTESLAIAGRNLFDDEASSSANSKPKPSSSYKSLRENSSPSSTGFQNPIVLPAEQTGNNVDSHDIWLIQGACTFQGLKSKNPIHHIRHYLSMVDNIQADGATKDTSRLCFFHFTLKGRAKEWLEKHLPPKSSFWCHYMGNS